MIAAEGLLTALTRNWDMVDLALDGLDDKALAHFAYIRGLLTGMGWYPR